MEKASTRTAGADRTRSIAFIALTVALIAVSAWVTIPLGPVPFTLQMFAFTFAIVVLSPRQAVVATAAYLLIGAVGVPVFSGMTGGIAKLAGPTGGFLWGYLIGVAAAALFLWAVRGRDGSRTAADIRPTSAFGWIKAIGAEVAAGLIFTGVAYVCGWAQLMAVNGLSPVQAFAAGVAPFIIVDIIKVIAAVLCARAVLRAVPQR